MLSFLCKNGDNSDMSLQVVSVLSVLSPHSVITVTALIDSCFTNTYSCYNNNKIINFVLV